MGLPSQGSARATIDAQAIMEVLREVLADSVPLWVPTMVSFPGAARLRVPTTVLVLTVLDDEWVMAFSVPPDRNGNMNRRKVIKTELAWTGFGSANGRRGSTKPWLQPQSTSPWKIARSVVKC